MASKLKSVLFSAFKKAYKLLGGTGVKKVPGVLAAKSFLFQLLWPNRSSIVEIQGSKMYVNPEGLPKGFRNTFQAYIVRNGWEELTTEMFKKVVKKGDIVVDLGANIGYFSLLAARLVGSEGKVYAFEPEPRNYSLLLKNMELNGYDNIVPVPKAVSNVSGTIRFFLHSKDTGAHTIYQPLHGEREFKESIEVQAVALDEFFKDKECPINVIKMDIEGAETAALLGMDRIISENENLKMFIEFHPPGIKRSGDSLLGFARRLLEGYHFSVMAIGDYARGKKYLKINTVDELMNFCRGGRTVNLFVEKSGR